MMTKPVIHIENSEFYKNFSSWDECCEKLKNDKPNITRTELMRHKAEYTKANQAPKKIPLEEISQFINPFFETYIKDENDAYCTGDGKIVFKNDNEFYNYIKNELTKTGALFADSQLSKEFTTKAKHAVIKPSSVLRMQAMLAQEYDTSKNWTKIFLEHFGFPSDDVTIERLQDFLKREIIRLERTSEGILDDSVNTMLVIQSEGGLGKGWIVSCLTRALVELDRQTLNVADSFCFHDCQTFPGFVEIEEAIKELNDNDIKQLVTSTKPCGRGFHKAKNAFEYCKSSFILTTNDIQDSFKNMRSTTDSGLRRRFFILKSDFHRSDIKTLWNTEQMVEVCKCMLRESYRAETLPDEAVYGFNCNDFVTSIAKDNIIISRIKELITVFIDERRSLNAIPYTKRSFKLYIRLGHCPRDEHNNEEHFPEFSPSAIRNDALADSEIKRLYGDSTQLTLMEIAERIGFNVSGMVTKHTFLNGYSIMGNFQNDDDF